MGRTAFLIAWLAPAVAAAQIVNVLPQIASSGDEGFSGTVNGTVSWKTGNSKVTQASAGASVSYRGQHELIYLIGRATYGAKSERLFGAADRNVFVKNTFEHLRYRRRLVDWLSWEAFAQHEYDEFRRLALRGLVGSGPRLELAPAEGWEVALASAYMFTYEGFAENAAGSAPEPDKHHRWSNYVQTSYAIDDAVSVFVIAFAQPRFDDFGDLRVLADGGLVADVNEWLAFKVSFNAAYDSEPPEGVRKWDRALTNQMIVKW